MNFNGVKYRGLLSTLARAAGEFVNKPWCFVDKHEILKEIFRELPVYSLISALFFSQIGLGEAHPQ